MNPMTLPPVDILILLLWAGFFAYWWTSALRNRTPFKRVPSRFGFLTTMAVPAGILLVAFGLVVPDLSTVRVTPRPPPHCSCRPVRPAPRHRLRGLGKGAPRDKLEQPARHPREPHDHPHRPVCPGPAPDLYRDPHRHQRPGFNVHSRDPETLAALVPAVRSGQDVYIVAATKEK